MLPQHPGIILSASLRRLCLLSLTTGRNSDKNRDNILFRAARLILGHGFELTYNQSVRFEKEIAVLRRFAGIAVCLVLAGTWLMRAAETTPEFGEHTDQLLRELGYEEALIDRLVKDGIVARTGP